MNETVLLIPGLLCDGVVWEAQVAALDADIRVADVTRDDSITAMAQRLLDEHTGPLAVAGHSMGARVALELTRLAPDRVTRLALLDTGIHPRTETEHVKRWQLVELGKREGMSAVAAAWLPPMVRDWDAPEHEHLRTRLVAMVERMNPGIHRRQIKALLDRPDARQGLADITCPTLVAVGDSDAWSPPEQHREIAAAIPGSHLVIFPNAGHMAPMENPNAVTTALRAWRSARA